jgi:hypothetical protein
MKAKAGETWKRGLAVSAVCFILGSQIVWAQSLGPQPQFNVAVQGQTGAQPEGAFLNFINWMQGRGVGRWLAAAAGLLAVSGITRLIEFWITNGTGGVT